MFEPKPLGEAIAFHTGGGTPSRQVPSYWGGGIPWASVKDFTDDAEYISATQETISQKGLNASASNLIPPGTPLVCTRMAVGRAAMPTVPVAINQDVKALYPAPGVTSAYLLSLLQYTQRFAEAQSIGSTVKGIRIQDYLAIPVPQAPEVEQPKIAEILATLNTAIHQTEAIVEKLKQVKQGLLHDLLTRGVDANGEMRPGYEEAPELYKVSPCGWIPNAWKALGLADFAPAERSVIRTGPFGSSLKGEHWRESGRPVVTIGSLGIGRFIEEELLFVDELTARRLSEYQLIPGDIVFSRVADVGRSVVVNEAQEGWIMSSNFMRISVNRSKVHPGYLQLLLAHSDRVRKQIRATVNSGGRDVANSAILMALRFPTPTPDEQGEIVNRNAVLSLRLEQESCELAKLLEVKAGLMDDLLTGRVRVTPLLAQ